MLFEYAIIHNPAQTKEQKDAGQRAKAVLVKPVTQVLAETEDEVKILAAREIPAELLDRLGEVVIATRPF